MWTRSLREEDKLRNEEKSRTKCLGKPNLMEDEPERRLYELSHVVITKFHKLSGSKQQTFILSQSWRTDVQRPGVSRGTLPLKALGEGALLSLSSSWWLPAILAILGFVDASLQTLPLSSHGHLPSIHVCVQFSLF